MKILLNKLTQHIPHLPNSERKVALFIVSNIDKIIGMSISEVAENSQASTAAVVRLCKKLDLEGFPELKIRLAKEIYSTESDSSEESMPDIEEASGMNDILDVLTANTMKTLNELKAVLSPSALEKVIERITTDRFILLSGVGASGLVAADFYHKLTRLGICSAFPADLDVQIVQASTLHPEDSAIFISYSGETEALNRAARCAKKAGATVIAITKIGTSTLSRIADIVLNIPDSEAIYRHAATSSRICQLMVVDIIYRGLINRTLDGHERLVTTWNAVREKQD